MHRTDVDLLRPLVDLTLEAAHDPDQERKKELWAKHQALQPTSKIPVCVTYEGIPASQWDLMFGEGHLQCRGPLARGLEFDLKKRLWVADHVGDDHIVWPFLWVNAVMEQQQDWGVPLDWLIPEDELGAKQMIAPFADRIDLSRLTMPEAVVDVEATRLRVEQAQGLVEGRMGIHVFYPNMGYAPFEVAIRMRGMQNLLYDVVDDPGAVQALMEFITAAMERHHQQRERNGHINCVTDASGRYLALMSPWRVIAAYVAPDHRDRPALLRDEWAYVTDQSSASLGPAMYSEFINHYHKRLAAPFTNKTVYYHGCENLDLKAEIILELPNLRRFHVSPWSSVDKIASILQGRAVMEVHAHPGRVFFAHTPQQMRDEIAGLIERADGMPMDLNLSDIHSVNGHPETLGAWAQIAQELAWRAA